MFLIHFPHPPLPDVSIASATPALGTSLVMIGGGRNRGAATSYDCGPGPPRQGFYWGAGSAKRWGTNYVEDVDADAHEPYFGTQLFGSEFDAPGSGHSTHEAQAALGDSGGAVFASNGPSYHLAGILIGVGFCSGQTAQTAIYGNVTLAADLSIYRDEIVETMPEPVGGLAAGAAFLAWLSRAGTRRACRGTACAASSPPRA
jgi:hypothetical protein